MLNKGLKTNVVRVLKYRLFVENKQLSQKVRQLNIRFPRHTPTLNVFSQTCSTYLTVEKQKINSEVFQSFIIFVNR